MSSTTTTVTARSRRAGLTGLVAAAAVAGTFPAAMPSAAAQSETVTVDVTIRPDGDVPRFLVGGGVSAASVLDDAVTSRTRVPQGDSIKADAADSTTTVTLGGRVRPGLRPKAARAWFFAGTQDGTTLRVEVVSKAGAVLAGTTVVPQQGTGWRSVAFRAPSRAALKGLSLRFVAVGGDRAEVRAAYVGVTSRTGPGATLRPRQDVQGLTVRPSGTAWAALDDAGEPPADPSYTERLEAGAAGRSTTVSLADVDASGSVEQVRAWYHAETGNGTRLRVEAVSGGQVRAAQTLGAASPGEWRSVTVPISDQQAVDHLQLRFTSLGGGEAEVAAASATVTLGESFDTYLNRYAANLPPLTAGPAKPAEPTGPAVQTVSEPLGDIDAPSGQSRYECVTTPVRASSNPQEIVTLDPDGSKMWLGALLQGRKYAGGPGSLADLPTTGVRAPIKIWTNLMGEDVTRTVADPDGAEVHQAIADMVREAQSGGVPSPARIAYSETSQSSVEEGLIKAGLSVKYMGSSGSFDLTSQRKAHQSSLFVSLTQRAFTVNLVRPNAFSDYFDDGFTIEELNAMKATGQIGPDNPPVVISNIAYGRVLYYSISSTASQEELEAAVKAAYKAGEDGVSIDVTARQQAILNAAEMKVFAMGGPTAGVENLIRTHKVQDYFAAENTLDRAVPISYQVDNLDGSPATFTETTDYNLRTCKAIENNRIDVGDVIRIEKPKFYLNTTNRNDAEMFGSLSIDGVDFWQRTRDRSQKIYNHVLTNPTSTDPAVDGRFQWPLVVTLDNAKNPLVRIRGSVNCALWFNEAGSNQYDWSYDSRSSQPRYMDLNGGSQTCRTDLRFQVTKVDEVWEYRP